MGNRPCWILTTTAAAAAQPASAIGSCAARQQFHEEYVYRLSAAVNAASTEACSLRVRERCWKMQRSMELCKHRCTAGALMT